MKYSRRRRCKSAYSETWHRAVREIHTRVSEEPDTFIFKIEKHTPWSWKKQIHSKRRSLSTLTTRILIFFISTGIKVLENFNSGHLSVNRNLREDAAQIQHILHKFGEESIPSNSAAFNTVFHHLKRKSTLHQKCVPFLSQNLFRSVFSFKRQLTS